MEKLSARLLSWASLIDEKTLDQAHTTARMPFIHPHLALMPDAHLGKGATVGSVIPTLGAIIPAAVGVDIGCGMIAVRTQFTKSDVAGRDLAPLRVQIERAVPLSAGHHNNKIVATAEPRIAELEALAEQNGFDPESYAKNWRLQLGSLGSGNHFIEVSSTSSTGCGCSCTRVRGVWATGSPATTSRWHSGWRSSGGSSFPTPTWPTWSKARRSSRDTSGNSGGPSTSRC